jgi:hypothetical protein
MPVPYVLAVVWLYSHTTARRLVFTHAYLTSQFLVYNSVYSLNNAYLTSQFLVYNSVYSLNIGVQKPDDSSNKYLRNILKDLPVIKLINTQGLYIV